MTSATEWHNVIRIVWSTGGVVAVNNPGPEVQVFAGLGGPWLFTLNIPTYPSLFSRLREQKFSILGTTFVDGQDEVLGFRAPQFRAMSDSGSWLAFDVHQSWRQIAHAAGQCDSMLLMDNASRIASGLAYSEMWLQDLLQAYSIQLRGRLHTTSCQEYQRFQDTNSFAVYKAIHALFWQMAVLRDALAEFFAKFCLARPGVDSLSGLISSLRKNLSSDPLAKKILDASEKGSNGWLATFTEYRNLFTHRAPMEQAAGIAFAVQDTRLMATDLPIPQIYYPLPSNVAELSRRRSNGPLFKTLKELSSASSGLRHQRCFEPDALEYLSACLDHLAQLSLELINRSPVAPKPIHIEPNDIIGDLKVTPKK